MLTPLNNRCMSSKNTKVFFDNVVPSREETSFNHLLWSVFQSSCVYKLQVTIFYTPRHKGIHSRLLRFSYSWGSWTGLVTIGPTKVLVFTIKYSWIYNKVFKTFEEIPKGENMIYFRSNRINHLFSQRICLYFDREYKKIISPFCQIVKDCYWNGNRMSRDDEKFGWQR